jgi:predicted transcriptional regulator
MPATTVTARVTSELRSQVDEIAKAERRTMSNVVELALECFVKQYTELHPQFRADILEGLAQMEAGDIVPYERG